MSELYTKLKNLRDDLMSELYDIGCSEDRAISIQLEIEEIDEKLEELWEQI